jgi:Raf kinase inhibitor-like YbhB/YbcL family protein
VSATRVVIALTIGVAALLTVAAAPVSARRVPFAITSPAFRSGGLIPDGFTCKGANASLPLRWRGVPKRTEELALIMEDPDAPNRTFVHWVAWGIDPTKRRIPEQTLPAGVVEGASGVGKPGYFGPCPPPSDGAHRYRITTYALDAAPDVAAGATATDLRAAIKGHVLATAKLVGRYDS